MNTEYNVYADINENVLFQSRTRLAEGLNPVRKERLAL